MVLNPSIKIFPCGIPATPRQCKQCFTEATKFNHNILAWRVSRVQDMSGMFYGASSFDQSISTWDASNVKTFQQMFVDALSFNQDLSRWNVSRVTDLRLMFYGALSFNQRLCAWGQNLSPSANAFGMFLNTSCPSTADPNLTSIPPGPFCHPCN